MLKFRRLLNVNYLYYFATKKVKQPVPLKVSRFKLNDSLGGHLIYQTNKSKNFLLVGSVLGIGICFSLLFFRAEPSYLNFFPLLISLGAGVIYQKRIFNTLKAILVQKTGETIRLTTYGLCGTDIFSKKAVIPIYILKGIHQKKINKAIFIKGGGVYNYNKFNFYFHEEGVLDKLVFDTIMRGHSVKYSDIL